MSWSKIIASYVVILQMVLAPMAAFAARPGQEIENGKLTEEGVHNVLTLRDQANKLNFDTKLDLPNKKMYFIDRDSKKVTTEVELKDENDLMAYSPGNMNKQLKALQVLQMSSKQAISHSLKAFPVESTAFFLALGGLAAIQLLTDYADNPVGMKQHIEHSFSPVGQMAFFMFMYSQGVTGNALNIWLQRPSLGMPIGMLAMTVGMAVQNYFSQVATDPHIRACLASVFKGEKIEGVDNPCDGAYKYLVIDKKILEFPGITSMLGTFALITAGRLAIGGIMRLIGFEVATLVAPGGIQFKAVRWLLTVVASGTNAAIFTSIQMKIEHWVSYRWKNAMDGSEFVDINDDFVKTIEAQKKSNWGQNTDKFREDLKEFSKKMGAWRAMNLSDVHMAHQAWSEFLAGLNQMYTSSSYFYEMYVPELLANPSLVDRQFPLYGVTPKGLAEGKGDNYLSRPDRIEGFQLETVNDVAAWMKEKLDNNGYKKMGLYPDDIRILAGIQKGLASNDIKVKSQAIAELNREYYVSVQRRSTSHMGRALQELSSKLGPGPEPLMAKGSGYAATFKLTNQYKEQTKNLQFDTRVGRFSTPDASDFFVMQMICGPDIDKKEPVITVTRGFPAKFNPPSITSETKTKLDLCKVEGAPLGRNYMYAIPDSEYKTTPDYLRANVSPEVKKDFKAWWDKNTEIPLREAYKGFAQQYKVIVSKLFKGLNETQNSSWNGGPISNGVMKASFQEMRFYSMILGELLKDAYKADNKKDLPAEYFSETVDPKIRVPVAFYLKTSKPILGLLDGSRYDFNVLTSRTPNADTRSLKIQKELEYTLALMNGLVQRSKTQKVTSEEFKDRIERINKALFAFAGMLGVELNADNGVELPTSLVKLSKDQKALAVTCLELIQGVGQEMSMYGNMAGAAGYKDAK